MLKKVYTWKIFVCIYFLFIFVTGTERSTNSKNRSPSETNECLQCKAYSDSFHYWFEKTSRGKFEGGDAAWEESKLKSYANSEVRLVEIQENLCSELKLHKDGCYTIAEQAETLIEKWWLEEISKSNLYSWLCMENLKYCCPEHTYGEMCSQCPMKDEQICSGHGTCNGDGTRQGDGSCICNTGYSGELCERCEINYFNIEGNVCKQCHTACQECFSYGPDRCKLCASGWQLIDGVCGDINECNTSTPTCKQNQFCINNIGSYRCLSCDKSCDTCSGLGPYNCTTCKPNDILWSGRCMDDMTSKFHLSSADKRLFLYVTLNTLMYLLYQKAKPLAVLMGSTLSILIFKLESVSDITVKDTVQNHIINFLKSNELM